ncbi:MAG: hypothetical protein Q7T01_01045 [bacterium]|nr:hypothetical protein [bacterium]
MSGENELVIFRLHGFYGYGGQYAVAMRQTGNTVAGHFGLVSRIVALRDSYDEAAAAFRNACDPSHSDYVLTEYGAERYRGCAPSQEEVDRASESMRLILDDDADPPPPPDDDDFPEGLDEVIGDRG